MTMTHTTLIVNDIRRELARLDANDTETNCSGIEVYEDEGLPEGWVRLSDGSGEAVYGPADAVLAALEAVDYDADRVVRYEPGEAYICGENEDGEPEYAADPEPVYENGWEKAWEALGEFTSRDPRKDS